MSRRILVPVASLGLSGFLVGQSFAADLYKKSGGKKETASAMKEISSEVGGRGKGADEGGGGSAEIKAVVAKMDLIIEAIKSLRLALTAHVEMHKHGDSGAALSNPGGPAEANQTASTILGPEGNAKKRKEFQGNRATATPLTPVTPGQ